MNCQILESLSFGIEDVNPPVFCANPYPFSFIDPESINNAAVKIMVVIWQGTEIPEYLLAFCQKVQTSPGSDPGLTAGIMKNIEN